MHRARLKVRGLCSRDTYVQPPLDGIGDIFAGVRKLLPLVKACVRHCMGQVHVPLPHTMPGAQSHDVKHGS